jgi:hypothetical protein
VLAHVSVEQHQRAFLSELTPVANEFDATAGGSLAQAAQRRKHHLWRSNGFGCPAPRSVKRSETKCLANNIASQIIAKAFIKTVCPSSIQNSA